MSDDVIYYIMKFEEEIQKRLMAIRFTALDIFQDVEEKLYYGAPSFVLEGKDIMNYVAYKKHISIILFYSWKTNSEARTHEIMDFLKNDYPQYGYTKCTIQFPHNEPFPYELIVTICKLLWQDVTKSAINKRPKRVDDLVESGHC